MKTKTMTAPVGFVALVLMLGFPCPCTQAAPGQKPDELAPTAPRRFIRIAWVVMQAKQLNKTLPNYPHEAVDKGIQGPVRLSITIDEKGKVENVKVLSGDPIMANPASDQIRQWGFQPTLLNREPIAVITELNLEFRYHKGKATVESTNAQPHRQGR